MTPLGGQVTTEKRGNMRDTLKRAAWLVLTAMGLFVVAVFIGGAFVASQDSSPSTSVAGSSFAMEVYWIMLAAAFPAVWLASETGMKRLGAFTAGLVAGLAASFAGSLIGLLLLTATGGLEGLLSFMGKHLEAAMVISSTIGAFRKFAAIAIAYWVGRKFMLRRSAINAGSTVV